MLARSHLSISPSRRVRVNVPDPSLLRGVVAREVLDAMEIASQALRAAGVRHVLVGGLAVGANGFPRATSDVVFLVGDEAFEHYANGLVTLRADVPFQVRGIAIDIVALRLGEAFLAEALDGEPGAPLDAPRLVYMKLRAPRHKDRTDVIELIKSGIDVEDCRTLLSTNAPDLLPDFEFAVRRARSEE